MQPRGHYDGSRGVLSAIACLQQLTRLCGILGHAGTKPQSDRCLLSAISGETWREQFLMTGDEQATREPFENLIGAVVEGLTERLTSANSANADQLAPLFSVNYTSIFNEEELPPNENSRQENFILDCSPGLRRVCFGS
jgi:hypothetical protein